MFDFSLASTASNATNNHSQVCIEGLLVKLHLTWKVHTEFWKRITANCIELANLLNSCQKCLCRCRYKLWQRWVSDLFAWDSTENEQHPMTDLTVWIKFSEFFRSSWKLNSEQRNCTYPANVFASVKKGLCQALFRFKQRSSVYNSFLKVTIFIVI